MRTDLNADMGQGYGAYRIGRDEELLHIVSWAIRVRLPWRRRDDHAQARGSGEGTGSALARILARRSWGFGRRAV